MIRSIRKILIANRGEIALRIISTARSLGISTVAVYSDADAQALFVQAADEAVHVGPNAAAESYLNIEKIIAAAKQTGADAVHPGYGFLSENPGFARALTAAGIIFIGPTPESMEAMALKGAAKSLMEDASVPVVPGYHGEDQDPDTLKAAAMEIGFPVLIKAVAGGGGKGMRQVSSADGLDDAIAAARREGENSFGNGKLLIEKYITKPRHIEVQVFGDKDGHVVTLWERDCSLQRRHQKVIEEAPAPGMPPELRAAMSDAARKAAEAISYVGAGTIEFIVDVAGGLEGADFYFMEMNTRLQVEHPVTEMITGQDLVEWQIRVAEGHSLPLTQDEIDATVDGHALEVRLYAEDPANGFLPSTGQLGLFDPFAELWPGARMDAGVQAGDTVSVHYDPMIAKVIAWGETREDARHLLLKTLESTAVSGPATNRDFLIKALTHEAFVAGDVDTGFIARFEDSLLNAAAPSARVYAAAALVELAVRNTAGANMDAWDHGTAWRMNLANAEHMDFLAPDGETVTVSVEHTSPGFSLNVGEASFPNASATSLGGGKYRLTLDGRTETIAAQKVGTRLTLVTADQTYVIDQQSIADFDTEDADGPGQLTAPMPGKILSVLVANGDTVERGAPLLIMEAMKMEQTLTAARSGVVAGLALAGGELVADGAVLLTLLDPDAPTTNDSE